jgi:hypothetical protein
MREFRYINLGDDILSAVKPEIMQDSWLIFPTERSCREAFADFQKNWLPLNVNFLSIDEFKRKVLYSENILLQDEKRLVCLYQAMSDEDKSVFHIEKYPDLIDWGQHFFRFFEDLAEECVDAESLLQKMLDNEFSYQIWQLENLERMLAIRKQYYSFISAKGYSDAIFDNDISNIHLPLEIKRYVFVNQFYYSRLELAIIEQIEAIKQKVIIIYQGSSNWLNESTLKSKELDINEAFPSETLPFRLKVYQSPSLWQMALAFLKNNAVNPSDLGTQHFVIDAKFAEQPYHKVFSKEQFLYPQPKPIHQTRLCHFFQIITAGLQSFVSVEGKLLIKTDWLLQAIAMKGFVEYFRPEFSESQKAAFTDMVYKFSENDILYLDVKLSILQIKWFDKFDPEAVSLLQEIMALLSRLYQISSISQMLDIIDSPNGIMIKSLLSEEELKYSNLAECFYEALANFMSMDLLSLVDDWHLLYPNQEVSAGIFDLFMTFVKPKTYTYNTSDNAEPASTITNLMDTRNLKAEKVTFLNLVEGELPSGRTPVWLFNEKQRQTIGLKCWEDIRSWERYYFYRIIASAHEVNLYTISNQDKDIEPSSFLNELCLLAEAKGHIKEDFWQEMIIPAPALLMNWLADNVTNPLSERNLLADDVGAEFFNLPCDPKADFGADLQIKLSWSACEHFIKNPILYYLQDYSYLRNKVVRLDETLSRKMFGTLLHKYLSVITSRLSEQNKGTLAMKWEWINNEFLTNNLKAALSDPILLYQIPRNYNWDYLKELMNPFLIETASWFFHVGLAKDEDFNNKFIRLIPETESMTKSEKQYKTLIHPQDNNHSLSVAIRGRADLRLETDEKCFIIDFKTGDSDALQLLFYMWSYYLIEHPELEDNIRCAIYKLMDKKLLWQDYKSKSDPAILVTKLLESIDKLVTDGYGPALDASSRRYFIDVTRADLLKSLSVEEEAE